MADPILGLIATKQQVTFLEGSVSYLLAFCRIALGLVFLLSGVSKLGHAHTFVQTIRRFRILPSRMDVPAAVVFLCSECAVVLCLLVGGSLLLPGFLLDLAEIVE